MAEGSEGRSPASTGLDRRVIDDAFGLSPLQHGMLFHHVKEPQSGVDIEQLVVHGSEILHLASLESAWIRLLGRHDILRARFVWDDAAGGAPRQEIVSAASIALPFALEDARDCTADEQRVRLRTFLDRDRRDGFDLRRAPLSRVTVFQWSDTSWSMVWTFHHILLDGRTFPLLLRELFEAYAGSAAAAPPPPAYRRHIDWLHAPERVEDFAAGEAFFKQQLAGFTAPTPIVIDRLRVPADAMNGPLHGEAWDALDAASTRALRDAAAAQGITLNTMLMGAWAILLHRYSGEEDVVFGATRACRKSSVSEADATIGLFINTVPVRVAVRADDAVSASLAAIRRQWVDMRPHEHTPLARAKAVSAVPAAQSLFDTLVVFENYSLDDAMRAHGGAWMSRRVELHELTSFAITLAAYDGEALRFKLEFSRHRIDAGAAQRLLGHLRTLLEGIAANPDARVRDLALVPAAEREALIRMFDAAPTSTPTSTAATASAQQAASEGHATLHGLFEAQAARRPQAVALSGDRETLTYAQLNARANRVARELVRRGVGPDTLVGLYVERSNALVIALLGILKAGGAYLPIDLTYPADRVAFMLEDAQAPLMLTETTLASTLPETSAQVLCIDELLATAAAATDDAHAANLASATGPDHLAYVIYTSGTTGRPKGSLITHRNVVRLFHATDAWYRFHERDVWTLFHSCAFDFSVWELWGALLYGGRLVVVPFLVSRSPEAFYELLGREQVTVLNQTPSAFRQLMQAEAAAGPQAPALALRFVIFGGEALEMQTLRPWFARHGDRRPTLVNMYGITETTVHVTYRPLSADDLDSGSVIGVPIPDLRLHVLDPRGEPQPLGIPGELFVGGAGLARGYLRRPELTHERFVADYLTGRPGARLYRTGDLARLLPGGDVEYLGRIDHQVKIRGFRIELGEIESVLCQHPAIREAAVLAREDAPGTRRLVGYLVTAQPAPSITDVRDHLKATLPEYMVPAAFVFLDALPLTNNGKIDRKALPAPETHRPDVGARFVAASTATERTLAGIWSQVLRVERVGIHDNFFALGGDSILTIQALSLARRVGLILTPTQFFANQTIAELARVARADAGSAGERAEDAATDDVPLTPVQRWFFEQHLNEPHHYNQAFLFEPLEPLERAPLERALAAIRAQHDALRLRYRRDADGWHQFYADANTEASAPVPLTWTTALRSASVNAGPAADADCGHADADWSRELAALADAAHASLDLEHGPLWRVVYIAADQEGRDKAPRGGRLLIVIHHLAVDGVSWRPLLEDLETAYRQIRAGQAVALPPKSASFKTWALRAQAFARSEALRGELTYWRALVDRQPARTPFVADVDADAEADDTEGRARTHVVSLTSDETRALLQDVPRAYRTHVNDVLLTALARAWQRWSGSRELFTNLEGHGREALSGDARREQQQEQERELDLARTVGWFTSIFPVRVELPAGAWHPGVALKAVKEQLRGIPYRGVGYGLLRYLAADSGLDAAPEPPMVFNYLGQFDQVIAGSTLFRFAPESSGRWHSAAQRRRHALEVNSLVLDGRLQASWTYRPGSETDRAVQTLADEFLLALREIVAHCRTAEAWGRTPSDFPLARLDQATLDRLLASRRDVEDVLPLSPIQTLFFAANRDATQSAFDQWQCTLRGPLDVAAFQRAWQEIVRRHSILRSSVHAEGLRDPVQLVHARVDVDLDLDETWRVEDWRSGVGGASQDATALAAARWHAFLARDRQTPLALTHAPAMRFALVRASADDWRFVWSVPALLLDGWSWPVVFREVSEIYDAFARQHTPQLEPARPYRDYLAWVADTNGDAASHFWKRTLAGFREPTPLPADASAEASTGAAADADAHAVATRARMHANAEHTEDAISAGAGSERYVSLRVPLAAGSMAMLQATARQLHVTVNTLVQGAWALMLSRQADTADVVFGAAFAGRPTDLRGADAIVGPFVNNLPVRVRVDGASTLRAFLQSLHAQLLALSEFQFTPVMEIQRLSEVPWRHRLFDSLVVFQNYLVDDAARRLGRDVAMSEFVGPVHTNFPVLLLAEPGEALRLTLVYDRQRLSSATVSRWAADLALMLDAASEPASAYAALDDEVAAVQARLSQPARTPIAVRVRARIEPFASSPMTPTQRTIASAWCALMGGITVEAVDLDDNFFDAGGTSLLLVQLHQRLRAALTPTTEFPLVTLFEHPTVRALARHLDRPLAPAPAPVTASVAAPGGAPSSGGDAWRQRVDKQKQALARLRIPPRKP